MIAWDKEGNNEDISDEDSMEETLVEPVTTINDMESRNTRLIPAKLICFIKNYNNEMNAIIHSCLDSKKKISVLTYQWEQEFDAAQKIKSKKVSCHSRKHIYVRTSVS